jgi:beta-N-acetylhexosaminidase
MNIESREQLLSLTASIHAMESRPLVLIDQEGGKVRRLKESKGFAPMPSQAAFQKLNRSEKITLARASYREMKELGIDMNLAPVVDLKTNLENPNIAKVDRAFSADPKEVRESVEILSDIAREAGILLCLKHYPGLGGASVNSHDEFTDLSHCHTKTEEDIFYDLAPAIPGEAVMVGHGVIEAWEPGTPISVSKVGIGRLRKRLTNALILSDDLQMQGLQFKYGSREASRLGLLAGLDLVLIGNNMINQESECFSYAEFISKEIFRDNMLKTNVAASIRRIAERKR